MSASREYGHHLGAPSFWRGQLHKNWWLRATAGQSLFDVPPRIPGWFMETAGRWPLVSPLVYDRPLG